MSKNLKEFMLRQTTGQVDLEFDDDSTQSYNMKDVVTAISDPVTGGLYFSAGSNVINFGFVDTTSIVKPDNFTDNHSAIQACINKAYDLRNNYSNSGVGRIQVLLPPGRVKTSPLTIPDCVELVGMATELIAVTGGYIITITGSGWVSGIKFNGRYADLQASGVNVTSTSSHAYVEKCNFDGFYGMAVYDQGFATTIRDIVGTNILYASADTLPDYTGGITLAGVDGWAQNIEISTRGANGMSASGKSVGLKVSGANYMVNDVIAETSDHGIYIGSGATQLKMDGCRGELCYGNGWLIDGGSGRITNPSALRNSKAGNALYNGWHNAGTSQFIVTGLISECDTSGARHNYGLFDNNYNATQFNTYINPVVINANNWIFTTANSGTSFVFPDRNPVTWGGTGTIDVRGSKRFKLTNSSAQLCTGFSNGLNGQEIIVKGDGNTTLQNNASTVLKSGSNTLLSSNTFYRFLRDSNIWYEI